ncbi:hypothetical protein CHUAL_007632 [Chamberlinius hualienensis]
MPNAQLQIDLNVPPESFNTVLQWIYTGDVNLQLNNIGEILHIAKQLEIDHLIDYCEETLAFLRDYGDDAVKLYEFAAERNMKTMAHEAAVLAADNFKKVVNSDHFVFYTIEQISWLLSLIDINIDSELDIFHAIRNWLTFAWDERKIYSLSKELIDMVINEVNPITWGEDGFVIDSLIRGLLKLCFEKCQCKTRLVKKRKQKDDMKKLGSTNGKLAKQHRMRHVKREQININNAAIRIQACFRGYKVRRDIANMNKAATTIQRQYRDYIADKRQKLLEDWAAKEIQWAYRRAKDQGRYLKLKKAAGIKLKGRRKKH